MNKYIISLNYFSYSSFSSFSLSTEFGNKKGKESSLNSFKLNLINCNFTLFVCLNLIIKLTLLYFKITKFFSSKEISIPIYFLTNIKFIIKI